MAELGTEAMRLLVDEVSKDDVEVHVIAFRKLSTVAKALGPERSRNELVPFLRGE
jgi:serine/threonine-protein phosphatase 2A regulatory subunit A